MIHPPDKSDQLESSPSAERTEPGLALSSETCSSSWCISAAVALILFGIISSTARAWQSTGPIFIPSGSYVLLPAAALLIFGLVRARARKIRIGLHASGFGVGLLLVFFGDWFDRSYNFFPNPSVRGEILFGGIIFLLLPTFYRLKMLRWALPLSILGLAATFLIESQGRLIFSDDHPSFLFRLSLLKEEFPKIPFYYPFWNGGFDARDFFATGSLGNFLVFSPLIYFLSVASIYNIIIAMLLFVIFPSSVFFASRTEGLKPAAQTIAALLALCASLVWYRWALKYGTMGFILSAALAPLVLSLALQLLRSDTKKSYLLCVSFVATASLMLLWSPSGLAFIPLGVFAIGLIGYRLFTKSAPALSRHALLAGILLLCVNVPWILIFWSVSDVGRFLHSTPSSIATPLTYDSQTPLSKEALPQEGRHKGLRHRKGGVDLGKSLSLLREKAFSTNPLIIFFSLPGLLLLSKFSRLAFAITALWLLLLGSVMVPIKPQLELDRMLLILSIILCVPAAASIEKLLVAPFSTLNRLLQALVAGFLLVSPFCVGSILANRTVEQYQFSGELTSELTAAIRTLGGPGRTVFTGCLVHEVDGGHVAPLSLWTGKELVASAPFHTLWRYTQVVPKSFMQRSDEGIEEYLHLMNATSVVAHEREWREYFLARPDLYRQAWRYDRFSLFERLGAKDDPFYEGEGILELRTTSSLTFRIDSEDAVIKYNYFPFLESTSCTIEPAQVAPEIQFIRLSGCTPGESVTIRSGSAWERVLR